MRWISVGCIGSVASAASAFAEPGVVRTGLIALAALSTLCLAYWGARSDRRVEEAHSRIVALAEQLTETSSTAHAAHDQANRPIWERRAEEFQQMFSDPIDGFFRNVWISAKRLVMDAGSRRSDS
jgi:hypothetical protein